jgi:acyl-homoserine-lactone acylase
VAADYPVYMAPEAENFRGVHAVRLLKDAGDLTLDSLIDLAYDPALPAFEVLIPGLVAAFDANSAQYPGLAPAIDVLRDWDFRVSRESVAMTLAHFYGLTYSEQGEVPDAMSGMERLTYFGTASPPEERLRVFADTVAALEADYGSWNMPWGEVNRFQRLTGDIEQPHDDAAPSLPVGLASGRWGSLAAYGSRRYPGTQKLYGYRGNSFVAVVEFGDKVRARTLLAGGQSGDPESRHFDDQARRYVDGEFKDVAYYREDVERRAERRYHPGE